MSNISIKMDMSSKHVHFYLGLWSQIKNQSNKKLKPGINRLIILC